jgi:hypothetical protein
MRRRWSRVLLTPTGPVDKIETQGVGAQSTDGHTTANQGNHSQASEILPHNHYFIVIPEIR